MNQRPLAEKCRNGSRSMKVGKIRNRPAAALGTPIGAEAPRDRPLGVNGGLIYGVYLDKSNNHPNASQSFGRGQEKKLKTRT
jgi:hypothetical protein